MQQTLEASFEQQVFEKDIPWRIFTLEPPDSRRSAFITPPHYANSIEFVLTEGIRGEAYIGGRRYQFSEKAAFYAAPGVVHAFNYDAGGGEILVCKFSLTYLEKYLNLQKIFPLGTLEATPEDHDAMRAEMLSLKDSTLPLSHKLMAVLRIFSMMHAPVAHAADAKHQPSGLTYDEFRTIIDWTEANLHRPIGLSEAAAQLGYNKNYFCSKFKQSNHTTYHAYLCSARINRACELLRAGQSISDVCAACGFQNESHFIQLFSRLIGTTPGKFRSASDGEESDK
ncbi:MAG: helix-turn-helix domain-containing protein [Clostridia bacterium]|nr:helix-turn-helix domain-containing protein [Clostridia bacterium]